MKNEKNLKTLSGRKLSKYEKDVTTKDLRREAGQVHSEVQKEKEWGGPHSNVV